MLLSRSSSLFYPSIKHAGVGKCYSKKNVPFSTSNIHLYNSNIGFSSKYDIVMPKKRYSCFTSGCHLHLSTASPATAADTKDGHAGIGILEFFEGKNILVTGATGLLGKVVVEKILRSTSVGKVYLLIKAKDKEAAFDRLNREIIRSEVMTCLKEKYGKSYEGFVREKLIAIVGDICEPNMGMDHDSIEAIRKDVHVIIQSAACTTFNERYDVMVDANVIAPQRVVRFAKTCHKLQLFTHVSTAYVSWRREGLILEEALKMGESGRKEGDDEVGVDVGDEISLLLKSSTHHHNINATKYFKKLGQQRAEMLGWDTTYQLSKSMGEMVVNEIRGDIPLLIIRPAIVESCYRQPLPGWIQGNRMFDPVAICYGKGQLPAYFGDPQVPVEFIPVDLVANTMIAAIAKHGNRNNNIDEVNVYHVASAASNPITSSQVFEYLYECFREEPLREQANIARLRFFDNFEEFSRYTTQEIILRPTTGDTRMIQLCNARVEYAQQLCKLYQFVAFFKARFHTGNTDKLLEEMSKEEKLNFEVDVRNINWKKYFQEIYVPGLRKYICN